MEGGSSAITAFRELLDFAQIRDPRILKAVLFIQANLQHRLRVGDVAVEVGLSTSRLGHLFRAEARSTPKQILTRLRMERVAELLATSDAPLKEIAAQVGMPRVAAFGQVFREWYGVTPARDRQAKWCPNHARSLA